MRFFRPTAVQSESGWNRECAEYDNYLASVLPQLGAGWREAAAIDFHDRTVCAVERPKKSELLLRIDMAWRYEQPPQRICTLYFTDLRHARIANSAIGDMCVHTEVHLTDDGDGALQVLLRQSELRIVAKEVAVLKNYEESDW